MTSFEHVGVMVGRLQHSSLLNSSPQQQQHANPRSHINRDKMVSLDAVLQCTKQALHICTKTLDCNFCPTQQSCVFLIPRLAVQMAVLVDQACRDYKLCFGHRKREYLGHDPMLLGQYSLDTLSEWLAVMGPVVLLQARGWEALLSRLTGFEDLGREEMVRSAMQSTHRSVTMILQLL
ncbi:hypothetical protein M436DRAFT_42667 [Aureobasidium namibiae CBS 147.97]|uniref:Uncharacterized protein n=1 Tax=Aureobasidium namibiae CBS 147.97 TaxID=1043004 RepID=A0A074WPR2_9PEZI|nr:uncharacterized protein M436DRAFT_42667 [Aureobasidium namibiae CBS 147.97]KEQ75115.1 hypothetical protein M436DRAFT_42667 [Aureobasidium namibiae CBS 147.97]